MTDAVAAPAAPVDAPAAAPTPVAAPAAAPIDAVSALTGAAPAAAPAPAAFAPNAPPPPPALALPGPDATPEQWAEFYGKIGRPETPDLYEMEIPEGDDGTFAKEVAPLLHEAGISAEQAKTLSKGWNAMRVKAEATIAQQQADAANAMNVKNQAEAEALKTEWGQAHEANSHYARQAVTQFLPAEHAAGIIKAIESNIGYAATIKMLHGIGKGLAEHDAAGLGSRADGEEKSLASRMYPGLK